MKKRHSKKKETKNIKKSTYHFHVINVQTHPDNIIYLKDYMFDDRTPA